MACRELRQISSPFHLQGTVVQAVNEDGKLSHNWVDAALLSCFSDYTTRSVVIEKYANRGCV